MTTSENVSSAGMWCAMALAVALGGGCQSPETIARTFDYGQAFIPAAATQSGKEIRYRGAVLSDRAFVAEQSSQGYRELAGSWLEAVGPRIKPGTRWPVVVFLHGCSGYAHYTTTVAEYYLAAGAVVVAPNSMNRPGRVAMCDSGSMAYRTNMRKQEARHAAQMLAALPWIDRQRMVLAGHSEGGNAVAAYSGDAFAALIITGINCRHNNGAVSAPRGVAVLAIKGTNDTTYPDGSCAVGRSIGGSRSVLIPGAGHMVLTSSQAKAAIYAFLQACCAIGTGPAAPSD